LIRALVRHLLSLILIAVVFIPAATALPLLSFWLCRTPWGCLLVFWCGPWSAGFWALIFQNFIATRWWYGREAVLAWRESRGGYLMSSIRSTVVMVTVIGASYALEFAAVFLLPPTNTVHQLLPLITYAPAAVTFWRSCRG
jgi:hypothetical protein